MLGLLGLVLVWKGQTARVPGSAAFVSIAEGMTTLLFLFLAASYAVKAVMRPGAVVDDLNTLPGRTGLAAMALGFLVLARFAVPRQTFGGLTGSALFSTSFLCIGTLVLLAIALYVGLHRLRGTDQAGPPTPAMHLVFVGFVLIPGSALPLGVPPALVEAVLIYCCLAALIIMAITIRPLLTGAGAPSLRPLQAIQLAPPGFLTVGAFLTSHYTLALIAVVWASLVAVLLVVRIRWLTEGGFSGFWSAFTFPATAYVGALFLVYDTFFWPWVWTLGAALLVVVTLYIPVIAYRVLKLWATGMLAAKTNASIA